MIGRKYKFVVLFIFTAIIALAAHRRNEAKANRPREMAVNGVGDARVVSIDVTIVNDTGANLVMPSCGQLLTNKYVVCLPPAFLEQFDGSDWKKVGDKGDHMYGELAEPLLTNVEPGASIRAHADFQPDLHEWQAAQPVRLVIPLWPASDKNREPENRIRYVTPPLQPPSAGRLAFEPKQ